MLDPASALVVYLRILQCLDAGANTLDKIGRAVGSSQDVIDVEHAADALRGVEAKEDTSNTRPPGKREPTIKQTEPEKAVPNIYEKTKKLADRLVPALQPFKRTGTPSSAKSGDGAKKDKGETEKLRRELDTVRLECARSLIQLLSMCACHTMFESAVLTWALKTTDYPYASKS